MGRLSQAPPLAGLLLAHGTFQGHAAHPTERPVVLSPNDSWGAWTPTWDYLLCFQSPSSIPRSRFMAHSSAWLGAAWVRRSASGSPVLAGLPGLAQSVTLTRRRPPTAPLCPHGAGGPQPPAMVGGTTTPRGSDAGHPAEATASVAPGDGSHAESTGAWRACPADDLPHGQHPRLRRRMPCCRGHSGTGHTPTPMECGACAHWGVPHGVRHA